MSRDRNEEDRILHTEREILAALTQSNETQERMLHVLARIEVKLSPSYIYSFQIKENTMALIPLAPGFAPVFTATPTPSNAFPSTPPTWTSSDTTNAPISVDSTGLVATVNIPSTAVVGTSVTLSISYTNADSSVATGSFTFTIIAAPSPDITSFTIVQTA